MDSARPDQAVHGRVLPSTFRPHPLLRNPHLQTILPSLLRGNTPDPYRRERWEREDGDFLDLGWFGGDSGPLLILLHGLTGGFDSQYARALALRLRAAGWRGVLMQFRGAGDEPNRLPISYHHGDTADLRALVALLRKRHPDTALHAAGWSLGGNVLLKYLGESGNDAGLRSAVACSVPFQLEPCAQRLRRGISRGYQRHLLGQLKQMMQRKFGSGPAPINLDSVLASRDFIDFDNRATAPLNGFENAQDYYTRASCGGFLSAIRIPTHIVHAQDDPFMSAEVIPQATALSPSVTLEVSSHGGHVGFLSAGRYGRPHPWLDDRVAELLLAAGQKAVG